MSGKHRQPRQRFVQDRQFYAWISLGILLLLTIVGGVFVYQVSPLRDPSFQPISGNAGSLLPWLQGVRESDWIRGATVLAALLASNIVLLFSQWLQSRSTPTVLQRLHQTRSSRWLVVPVYLFLGLGHVLKFWEL